MSLTGEMSVTRGGEKGLVSDSRHSIRHTLRCAQGGLIRASDVGLVNGGSHKSGFRRIMESIKVL